MRFHVGKIFLNLRIHKARPTHEDEQLYSITPCTARLRYTLKQAYSRLTEREGAFLY